MGESVVLPAVLRLGTRGSALARWQTDHVADLLQAAWPGLAVDVEIMQTRGDKILDTPLPLIGGKGVFTEELEAGLRDAAIDLAVHSLKDLPTALPPSLAIGAVPPRASAHDVLVSRSGQALDELPPGATVGTSSSRRAAQLRHHYPHLRLADLRGNVDTRLRKALDPAGPYDAIVLAQAGLERLGLGGSASQVLPFDLMLPAPGQGALAVQCRDDAATLALLAPIDDAETRAAVTAERAFLQALGGGCAVPVAAFAAISGGRLLLQGRVNSPDGARQIDVAGEAAPEQAESLGRALAQQALAQGADELLEASL